MALTRAAQLAGLRKRLVALRQAHQPAISRGLAHGDTIKQMEAAILAVLEEIVTLARAQQTPAQ